MTAAAEVAIWWIGEGPADPALVDVVRRALERELGLGTRLHASEARPSDTLDPRRNQHSSSRIVRWLSENLPAGSRKLLGLTDVDLFIPILTFVFGEAQLGGAAAVASVARLGNGELPHDPRRLAARLEREALHEIGHTFGLVHCERPRCVMARAAGLREVDEKSSTFCQDCRVRLAELRHRDANHEQGVLHEP